MRRNAVQVSATEREGNLSVSVRVDKRITSALNAPGSFTGRVNNSANVGKTTGEIVQMWNEAHPEDMIVLPLNHKAQPQ